MNMFFGLYKFVYGDVNMLLIIYKERCGLGIVISVVDFMNVFEV